MKNPFKKKKYDAALISGVIIGSAAAGIAAYLMFTKQGKVIRQQIAGHFNSLCDNLSGHHDDHDEEQHTEYMHHPNKKPKTDREALLKNEILGNNAEEAQGGA